LMQMILISTAVLILTTILVSLYKSIRQKKLVERVYFARGYVYVAMKLETGELFKGFITRGALRDHKRIPQNYNIVLESYKTGEARTVNTSKIDWIRQLKPPEKFS